MIDRRYDYEPSDVRYDIHVSTFLLTSYTYTHKFVKQTNEIIQKHS